MVPAWYQLVAATVASGERLSSRCAWTGLTHKTLQLDSLEDALEADPGVE